MTDLHTNVDHTIRFSAPRKPKDRPSEIRPYQGEDFPGPGSKSVAAILWGE